MGIREIEKEETCILCENDDHRKVYYPCACNSQAICKECFENYIEQKGPQCKSCLNEFTYSEKRIVEKQKVFNIFKCFPIWLILLIVGFQYFDLELPNQYYNLSGEKDFVSATWITSFVVFGAYIMIMIMGSCVIMCSENGQESASEVFQKLWNFLSYKILILIYSCVILLSHIFGYAIMALYMKFVISKENYPEQNFYPQFNIYSFAAGFGFLHAFVFAIIIVVGILYGLGKSIQYIWKNICIEHKEVEKVEIVIENFNEKQKELFETFHPQPYSNEDSNKSISDETNISEETKVSEETMSYTETFDISYTTTSDSESFEN